MRNLRFTNTAVPALLALFLIASQPANAQPGSGSLKVTSFPSACARGA
jgi:hypothetical protein